MSHPARSIAGEMNFVQMSRSERSFFEIIAGAQSAGPPEPLGAQRAIVPERLEVDRPASAS